MCKLYLRFIHGKDVTFENIFAKNFAHERSKLLRKVGTVKEGLVFSKMLNLGEDVCGLHGAKYARTFGCLITFFFNVHLSVLFSAQSVTQVLPWLRYPCCVFSPYINRPLPLKNFHTKKQLYRVYINMQDVHTKRTISAGKVGLIFAGRVCIRQQKGRSDFRTTFFISVP